MCGGERLLLANSDFNEENDAQVQRHTEALRDKWKKKKKFLVVILNTTP